MICLQKLTVWFGGLTQWLVNSIGIRTGQSCQVCPAAKGNMLQSLLGNALAKMMLKHYEPPSSFLGLPHYALQPSYEGLWPCGRWLGCLTLLVMLRAAWQAVQDMLLRCWPGIRWLPQALHPGNPSCCCSSWQHRLLIFVAMQVHQVRPPPLDFCVAHRLLWLGLLI